MCRIQVFSTAIVYDSQKLKSHYDERRSGNVTSFWQLFNLSHIARSRFPTSVKRRLRCGSSPPCSWWTPLPIGAEWEWPPMRDDVVRVSLEPNCVTVDSGWDTVNFHWAVFVPWGCTESCLWLCHQCGSWTWVMWSNGVFLFSWHEMSLYE